MSMFLQNPSARSFVYHHIHLQLSSWATFKIWISRTILKAFELLGPCHRFISEHLTLVMENFIVNLVKIQNDSTLEVDLSKSAPVTFENSVEGPPCNIDHVTTEFNKSVPKLKIAMVVVGTRGDVQPFLAVAKRLQEFGHHVRLATHVNFSTFVKSAGIDFYPLGDMAKNKGLIPSAPGEILMHRKQIKAIIESLLPACTGPDIETGQPFRAQAIIANPPAYGHAHVAEALGVPLHIFFTIPWTPTNEFPHPLIRVPQSAGYWLSYIVVDLLIWWGIRGYINDLRTKKLKLAPIAYFSWYHGSVSYLPTAYMWSPHVVPKPSVYSRRKALPPPIVSAPAADPLASDNSDLANRFTAETEYHAKAHANAEINRNIYDLYNWGPLVDVGGYCFLNLGLNYQPPEDFVRWIKKGPQPIYIGFGSMLLEDPKKTTEIILEALKNTGQRGIIDRGWGGLVPGIPDSVFCLVDCPHDWLFPQCLAVVHHGGAGTTATGLRAGCPTTIVPFFGDQFFWGDRLYQKGLGPTPIPLSQLSVGALSDAIRFMLKPEVKSRAMEVAKLIENEDGVVAAVDAFHRHLPPEIPLPRSFLQDDDHPNPLQWLFIQIGKLCLLPCVIYMYMLHFSCLNFLLFASISSFYTFHSSLFSFYSHHENFILNLVKIQNDSTLELDLSKSAPVASKMSEPKSVEGPPCNIDHVTPEFNKSVPKLKIAMVVVGTRGDVQPFLAVAKRLQEFGHHVRLATHVNFSTFVKSAGIDFYPLGDMAKNKGLIPSAPGEMLMQRKQIKAIIESLLPACTGPDIETGQAFRAQAIIANPLACGHAHVAEALGVPLHIFFTIPWTPTNEFPHPLIRVPQRAGYWLSYIVVDLLIWWGIRGFINDLRTKKLKLAPIAYFSWYHGSISYLPTAYMWSPHVVPKPSDWGPLVDVGGYCFLNLGLNYQPPEDFVRWIKKGPQPIYIGFGSMLLEDPKKTTEIILEALKNTGQRGIIDRGWGGLGMFFSKLISISLQICVAVPGIPDSVFCLVDCPHDWLFPQCLAVVHHGGAGTTATGLRAGCPTTIVPFFGDQFFWGDRLYQKGLGPTPIPISQLSVGALSDAIRFMLKPEVKSRAMEVAKLIENEDGVVAAVDAFHCHLPPEIPLPSSFLQDNDHPNPLQWLFIQVGKLCLLPCETVHWAGLLIQFMDFMPIIVIGLDFKMRKEGEKEEERRREAEESVVDETKASAADETIVEET
ncbi:hypothetical protein HYC85_008071 [Camellia sinensis]|uniref:Glycosyltransferase family 28 N-terminal domain-containing protein n=1 Tax=Camellia sinensis TaxID=4442 RepID=A0A7J7HRP2_CAMSI|nr:hypothetical protein HYC85_008071 [Camellia sinensis]